MKTLLLILLTLFSFTASAQEYPFAKDFVQGTVMMKDGSSKPGWIKWIPGDNQKLKFRENEKGETVKYAADEIAGFESGEFRFVALHDFSACESKYALIGKTTRIKHSFAQVLAKGEFNIYYTFIVGYDPISSAAELYPNILFQHATAGDNTLYPYPVNIRMKDKRYEAAKDDLYILFKDYPVIIDMLRRYQKKDDFMGIVNAVAAIGKK